jgi:hypothetical protein
MGRVEVGPDEWSFVLGLSEAYGTRVLGYCRGSLAQVSREQQLQIMD